MDRRTAGALLAGLSVAGLVAVVAVPVLVGGLLAVAFGAPIPALGDWLTLLVALVETPTDLAGVFGAPVPAGLFWPLTVVTGCGVAVGCGWCGREGWRLLGPTGTGFATRHDIGRDLSETACRRRAAVTRPDLDRKARRTAPAGQVGIPLHAAAVSRARLWLPLENATGVIAPQQSGKTLMDLIHKVLAAPGAVLVTSTKLDLYLHTALARRRDGSPVAVLDLTGQARWPVRVRWNPIRGCTTVSVAKRRAQALLRATTGDRSGGRDGSNHAFFERRAVDVLTAYLLAASLSGATIEEFLGWCQNDRDTDAVDILRTHPGLATVRRTLQQAQAVVDETRTGIWETLRDAISCLTDPDLAATLLPTPEDPGFDSAAFLTSQGTVYVIGSEDDAATQAPLVTAFVQDVLDTARRTALAQSRSHGRERLTPPFTAVLDEIASICPLPDLPATLSDSAGRGILIHYALQSPAQAQARWGRDAATLFDNTTALTLFGGLKSEETLKWASLLAGRRLEERTSRQTRGFEYTGQQIGTERVDLLEPGAVRQLARGRALLIVRHLPPLIVHLQPAWTRPDWTHLTHDAHHLRTRGRPDTAADLAGPAGRRIAPLTLDEPVTSEQTIAPSTHTRR